MNDHIDIEFDETNGHMQVLCDEAAWKELRTAMSDRWGDVEGVDWCQVKTVTIIGPDDDAIVRQSLPRQRWLTIGCVTVIVLVVVAASIGVATVVRWLFA